MFRSSRMPQTSIVPGDGSVFDNGLAIVIREVDKPRGESMLPCGFTEKTDQIMHAVEFVLMTSGRVGFYRAQCFQCHAGEKLREIPGLHFVLREQRQLKRAGLLVPF